MMMMMMMMMMMTSPSIYPFLHRLMVVKEGQLVVAIVMA
jgi:hypothetical protein